MTEIPSCSYECDRPECIRAQRDELAARMAVTVTPDEIAEVVRRAVEAERERCARVCESFGGNGPGYIDDDWAQMCAAAIRDGRAQQPAAPSGAVNVVGMPEFDGLMDHIYEYGTTAEGVVERANAFARAVLAQYAPQQPAAWEVDEDALRDARTIYDIACIRESRDNATREDVEFKAICLRNYNLIAALMEARNVR